MVRYRWLRRKVSRIHWAARLLGIDMPVGETDEPGLLLFQIDGLSRRQFEAALAHGKMPFLKRLFERGHFSLEDFYSGMPSTTPAVQAEIFFGLRGAVPAFEFLRRGHGRIYRMYEAECAAEIEGGLHAQGGDPLLRGGHVYSGIYRAGAKYSHYCSQDLMPDKMLRRMHPVKVLLLGMIYAPKVLRMVGLAILELGLAIVDCCKGLFAREDLLKELAFIPARILVCIVLREMIRLRVMLDIERGLRVVHANFLGYDEQSHRRGPGSAFAHWTLKGIDDAIAEICRAASHSPYRDYEWIIHSDHGQEQVQPYVRRHGRELDVALREMFATGPLAGMPLWVSRFPEVLGSTLNRCRSLLSRPAMRLHPEDSDEPRIVVTALGPLGHVYFPARLAAEELARFARRMVDEAGIPTVSYRDGTGTVHAFNRRGDWILPDHAAEVLGPEHPFLDEVARDWVGLAGHVDAGDLILSGWDPEEMPLTFPMENGSHGGPGTEETHGFMLLPDRIRRWHIAHLRQTRKRVRGVDFHHIALHFLGRDGQREERVAHYPIRSPDRRLRVMSYNIHSCLGMDGKIRPERVARVINFCDPDVVALQEIDVHRVRSGGRDQAKVIADHLRMEHEFHAVFEEEHQRYGIAIFSKHPFTLNRAAHLTNAGPGALTEARAAIWITLTCAGLPPVHVINTHFGLGRDERSRQVSELLGDKWLGAIDELEPVVLCGDFNSGPRSKVFRRLHERLHDVQLLAANHNPQPTFATLRPMLRIDHIFVSRHFDVNAVHLPRTPTAMVASDHLPLSAELVLSRI